MTPPPRLLNCACCYQLGIAELRWDKYGRPWVMCGACGARTFTRTPNALKGIYMTSRMVESVRRVIETDVEERARREAEAEAFVRDVRAEREALASGAAQNDGPSGAKEHGQVVSVAAASK